MPRQTFWRWQVHRELQGGYIWEQLRWQVAQLTAVVASLGPDRDKKIAMYRTPTGEFKDASDFLVRALRPAPRRPSSPPADHYVPFRPEVVSEAMKRLVAMGGGLATEV